MSSERETRPLTPTDLEREAASGDRQCDDQRVLHDLSRCVDEHLTARKFFNAFMHCECKMARIPFFCLRSRVEFMTFPTSG